MSNKTSKRSKLQASYRIVTITASQPKDLTPVQRVVTLLDRYIFREFSQTNCYSGPKLIIWLKCDQALWSPIWTLRTTVHGICFCVKHANSFSIQLDHWRPSKHSSVVRRSSILMLSREWCQILSTPNQSTRGTVPLVMFKRFNVLISF